MRARARTYFRSQDGVMAIPSLATACGAGAASLVRQTRHQARPFAAFAWLGLCAGVLLMPSGSGAQQVTPELKVNPIAALKEFEPDANQAYQLGRGDEIAIDFAGRPELSSKRVVGPDGRITLPLAGSIALADKTREQAADSIVAALAPYYNNLSATVGVERYTSNRVLLLGAVEHPGIVTFDQPPTLLELLTRGGGPSAAPNSLGQSGAGMRSVTALPDRLAIYRGTDKVMWVELKGLLDSGSPLADLRLKRDDIVYVPSASERYVSVLGQVQHPGALQLDSTTTLVKLIAEAGGITQQAGRDPDIQIIQPSTGSRRMIPFKTLLTPGKLDLTLKSGDVIFVPQSGFNGFTYALERLSPLVTMFTAAAILNR